MVNFGYLLPTRGVVLASEDAASLATRTRADVVDLGYKAEVAGFDSLWVGDSVIARPRHEPLTSLAAIAGKTEAIRLGTAVYLPALRHPINVAHQTATLDQLSGGRFRMGVGVGIGDAGRHEYEQLDIPFDRRGAVVDESLEVITSLWSDGPVDFEGEFFNLENADTEFPPCSTVPVYVGSAVDPRDGFPKQIRRRFVTHGDGWFPTRITPEMFEAGRERLEGALDDAGRDPDRVDWVYYFDVVVDDSEREAIEMASRFREKYYPEWQPTDDRIEEMKRQGAYGTPGQIKERIEIYRRAGVETFVTRFTADNQREQLNRFAELIN